MFSLHFRFRKKIEFSLRKLKKASRHKKIFSVVYSTDYNAMNGQSVMIQNNWIRRWEKKLLWGKKSLKVFIFLSLFSVKAKNRKYCAGRKWSNILSRTQKFVLNFFFISMDESGTFQDIMVDCKCKIFFIKFSNLLGFLCLQGDE